MTKLFRIMGFLLIFALCFSAASGEANRTILLRGDFIRFVDMYNILPDGYTGIYTADDLLGITRNPSGRYMLMADIDLSGHPDICESLGRTAFSGLLDGNGHRIDVSRDATVFSSDDAILIGLFKEIQDGTVQNLRITGDYSIHADPGMAAEPNSLWEMMTVMVDGSENPPLMNAYVGGLAGGARGESSIINCTSSVMFSYRGNVMDVLEDNYAGTATPFAVGGFVGCAGDGTVTFRYCRNESDITGPQMVGGIVGHGNNRTGTTTIEACENLGDLYSVSYGVGGIAGFFNMDQKVVIRNCANHGKIEADNFVGGILGWHESDSDSVIEDCINLGDVHAHQESYRLYGYFGSDNLEQFSGYENYKGYIAIGGIAGFTLSSVDRCVNFGEVTAKYYGAMSICGGNKPSRVKHCYIGKNLSGLPLIGNLKGKENPGGDCSAVSGRDGKEAYTNLTFSPLRWQYLTDKDYPYPAALCRDRWLQYRDRKGSNKDVAYIYGQAEREAALTIAMDTALDWGSQYTSVVAGSEAQLDGSTLEGTVFCFIEGYGEYPNCGVNVKQGETQNERSSAMCVVYKNGQIIFATGWCATFPDYPLTPSSNDYSDNIPTVLDGVYRLKATQHAKKHKYPAMNVVKVNVARVYNSPSSPHGKSWKTDNVTSEGVNMHQLSGNLLGPLSSNPEKQWVNSSGCTVIGQKRGSETKSDYSRIAYLVGFAKNTIAEGYGDVGDFKPINDNAEAIGIWNRSIGFDNVEAFHDGFMERYDGWTELLDLIMRRSQP